MSANITMETTAAKVDFWTLAPRDQWLVRFFRPNAPDDPSYARLRQSVLHGMRDEYAKLKKQIPATSGGLFCVIPLDSTVAAQKKIYYRDGRLYTVMTRESDLSPQKVIVYRNGLPVELELDDDDWSAEAAKIPIALGGAHEDAVVAKENKELYTMSNFETPAVDSAQLSARTFDASSSAAMHLGTDITISNYQDLLAVAHAIRSPFVDLVSRQVHIQGRVKKYSLKPILDAIARPSIVEANSTTSAQKGVLVRPPIIFMLKKAYEILRLTELKEDMLMLRPHEIRATLTEQTVTYLNACLTYHDQARSMDAYSPYDPPNTAMSMETLRRTPGSKEFLAVIDSIVGNFHGHLPVETWVIRDIERPTRNLSATVPVTSLPTRIPTLYELDRSAYEINCAPFIKRGIHVEGNKVHLQTLSLADFRYICDELFPFDDEANPLISRMSRESIMVLSSLVPDKKSYDIAVSVGFIPSSMTPLMDYTWWSDKVINPGSDLFKDAHNYASMASAQRAHPTKIEFFSTVSEDTYRLFVMLNNNYYGIWNTLRRDMRQQLKFNPLMIVLATIAALFGVFAVAGVIQVVQGFQGQGPN